MNNTVKKDLSSTALPLLRPSWDQMAFSRYSVDVCCIQVRDHAGNSLDKSFLLYVYALCCTQVIYRNLVHDAIAQFDNIYPIASCMYNNYYKHVVGIYNLYSVTAESSAVLLPVIPTSYHRSIH